MTTTEDLDLGDWLADTHPVPSVDDAPAREAFVVDDDEKATWAARHLARHQGHVERLEQQARVEKARIDEWLTDAASGERSQVSWFTGLLEGFARRLHRDDEQAPKTYRFVGGSVGRRKKPDTVTFLDEAAFVQWALEEGRVELLSIKPSLSAVKGLVTVVDPGVSELVAPAVDRDKKGAPTTPGQVSPLVTSLGEVVPGVEYQVGVEDYWGKADPA